MGAIDPVLELLRCRAAAFLIIRSLIESVARSHVALSFAMLAVASARTSAIVAAVPAFSLEPVAAAFAKSKAPFGHGSCLYNPSGPLDLGSVSNTGRPHSVQTPFSTGVLDADLSGRP